MKKKYFCIALLFEFAACIGAYIMQYFTAKKLGMLRWVNHLCNEWSKSIDLDRLNLTLMLLVSGFAVALLLWTIKKTGESIRSIAPFMAIAVGAVGVSLVWILCFTRRMMAAYYLVSLMLVFGAICVLTCWLLAVLKNE